MLNIKKPAQLGTIPTLRLEAMRGLASKLRILQLNCLFNNYNVIIPQPIVLENIVMLNIKESGQFGTIPSLRLEVMQGLSLETSNFPT